MIKNKWLLWGICCWLLVLLQPTPSVAQAIFQIKDVQKNYYLPTKSLHVFQDTSKIMTFEKVRSTNGKELFQPFYEDGRLHDPDGVYWVNFSVKNVSGTYANMMLYIGFNNKIDVYTEDKNGQITHQKGGQYIKASERSVKPGRVTAFHFSLENGEKSKVWVRIENFNKRQPYVEPILTPTENWHGRIERRNMVEGLFYGLMLMMFFYNFFVFISFKDKTYLYYSLYIFNVALYFFVLKGFSKEYFFGEFPRFEAYAWTVSFGLSPIFYFKFIRYYLNTSKLIPFWDKVLKIGEYVLLLIVLVEVSILYFTFHINIVGSIALISLVCVTILAFIILIYLARTRNRLAYYLIIGSSFLWIGSLVGVYVSLTSFFMEGLGYGQVGVVLEVMVFSLGLGYRMRITKGQKEQAQKELIIKLMEIEELQSKANKELEEKVTERTQELSEKQEELERQNEEITMQRDLVGLQKEEIEKNNKKLIALNEEKNHLIGIVAHDLRNPLSSALSMAELLRSDSENFDEDQVQSLGLISRSLERINKMVGKILDLKAIEADHLNIHLEQTDVQDVLRQAVESYREKAKAKRINLSLETLECCTELDRSYLMQIVENLISNAVKFSSSNSNIWVKMSSATKSLRIEVKDEGPGLSPEDKKKLFGKFQRLSAEPTGGETSTGLGLSIVKKYVEAMNGEIWCESELGKGAKFVVLFSIKN
ncbi:sensor histidine kinase [Flammeovirgaceae bacterium SG7u.111]|nr:sensor histidine kinase [Flammeovirgaceae bacterium SG7u.132]WPO36724.1 sensor histidine kinase [Flammeovirgaceae bacterium SG7u.111]